MLVQNLTENPTKLDMRQAMNTRTKGIQTFIVLSSLSSLLSASVLGRIANCPAEDSNLSEQKICNLFCTNLVPAGAKTVSCIWSFVLLVNLLDYAIDVCVASSCHKTTNYLQFFQSLQPIF